MKRTIRHCFLVSALLGVALWASGAPAPKAVMSRGVFAEGAARVSPDWGVAGEFGTWTVKYEVGKAEIQTGGGIRVQLPDTWHSGPRNSANRLQATDPKDEHYVKAYSSRAGVKLETTVEGEERIRLVKSQRPSLDGRLERYVFVVRVRVTEGVLQEGDVISVVYGDRSGGSPGYRAADIATSSEPVLVAVDARGNNQFQLLKNPPFIRAWAGEPTELLVNAPSQAPVNRPLTLKVALLDVQRNPAVQPERVQFTVLTGRAEVSGVLEIPQFKGWGEITVIPKAV
ncbi:MAG: hypothetical protein AB1705_17875, partial [Verrucomicrobiota bacterium]